MTDPVPLTPAEVALIERAGRPTAAAGRLLLGLAAAILVATGVLFVALSGQLRGAFETEPEARAHAYGLLIGRLTAGLAAAGGAFAAVVGVTGWLLVAGPVRERDRLIRKLTGGTTLGPRPAPPGPPPG